MFNNQDIDYMIREEGWNCLRHISPDEIEEPSLRKLVLEYRRAVDKIEDYLNEEPEE